VLAGDPAAAGSAFTLRVKMPAGYKVPPHWHPADENLTVLQGTLMAGMGDTFDAAAMKTLTAGSFATMPKEMRHYVRAKTATVIQVHGTGPFAITYVNPADDPRTKSSN
jgi:quercetin dioxygenase-like cupin family protein